MLYRLFTLLILLLSAPAWGTTYNIGPGQTYETFAAFFAAVTPAAGDIVDGGNNTFNEQVTIVTGSGTSGNPVIYRDFTADAQSTRDHGVYVTEVGVTLQNVTGKNALQNGISFVDSSYITVTNCSGINNAHFGLWVRTYEASHTTIYVSGGAYTGNAEHGILLMGYPVANRISTVAISGVTASNSAGAGI